MNFYKAYSPQYHCESPDPVRILLGLSDPNNLLFHPNNQRKSQILSWWECSQFERIQGATNKKR